MTRPWEVQEPLAPWLSQQPVYDRLVSIRRPIKTTSLGTSAYGGLDPTQETVVLAGLPATIEIQRQRSAPEAGVPADLYERTGWRIFIPVAFTAAGQIVERDVIADDLGRRFLAIAAMPSALGYQITADLLET